MAYVKGFSSMNFFRADPCFCRAVIHTLPDKGAKLKQSIRQIDVLLLNPGLLDDDITVENTFADHESALTSKLAGLTFLTPKQEARKRGIAIANARAQQQQPYVFKRRNSSSVLMRRPSTYLVDEAEQAVSYRQIVLFLRVLNFSFVSPTRFV